MAWLTPFGLAAFFVVAVSDVTFSQQLPGNLSPDQFQLLQQFGQQNQGQSDYPAVPAQLPQPITLLPAARDFFPLPQSRLEQILSARTGIRLQQFGYVQFGYGAPVIVPQTGAVQDDYILGPGDEVVISLRGQENIEYRAVVDRNGQVSLPRLRPISASGRAFGSLRQDVQAAVRSAYIATDAFVAVGRLRQISVLVSGEVNNPGQHLLTGLSSAIDALLLSGGVKKSGSLRSVRVMRGRRQITLDLYGILTDRAPASNFRLADGDRVVVPLLGQTVAVAGLVRQPGIYELPPRSTGISARDLLDLAGGQEVRGTYRMSVLRILPDGRSSMAAVSDDNTQIRDSEVLMVQLGADEVISQTTLVGGSGLAGNYPILSAMRLSDMLKAPGALGQSPYTLFGILVRKDPVTLLRSLTAFTPVAVLAGREDLELRNGDMVRPLSANEAQLLTFIVRTYLQGLANRQATIRNPLGAGNQSQPGQSLAGVVASQAGQGTELTDISSVPAEAQRQQVMQVLELPMPGSYLAQQQQADEMGLTQRARQRNTAVQQFGGAGTGLESQLNPSSANTPSLSTPSPGSPSFSSSNTSETRPYGSGSFPTTFPPPYPQLGNGGVFPPTFEQARNFTEQVASSDSYAGNQEVQSFGQLARQLSLDPLILINFLIEWRVRLDGAVRGPGYYLVGPNASLQDVLQAAGGTSNWADEKGVDLISTQVDSQTSTQRTQHSTLPLRQGLLANYIVKPRDQLRFNSIFSDTGVGLVTVQGEVRAPGSFALTRGERLSDLLVRAGGLTSVAYPYGTVFLRQSVAQREREGYVRAASEIQNQLVIAMTRIGNDKIEPSTFASMQTFVSELRNQQAMGRISVTADPSVLVANRELDPLLEPGDVIYIPQRPATVSVLGQVLQPGSFPYRAGSTLSDYIAQAGGYAATADSSQTFVILPDGSARRVERSWLRLNTALALPPGSSIVVPRDVTPLDLRQTIMDVTQIFSQFAIAIASVAVLSKQ